MKEKIIHYRYWLIGVGCGVLLLLILSFQLFFRTEEKIQEQSEDWMITSSAAFSATTEESEQTMYVDVKGAVLSPGIYPVEAGMRVWDAVKLAGGMTDQADGQQINLSQRLEDQMVIYVPKIGEATTFSMEQVLEKEKSEADGRVDLNTATEQELMTLSGIGQKKAQDIISYREETGLFSSIEELANISGFGAKTIEKIRESIYVS